MKHINVFWNDWEKMFQSFIALQQHFESIQNRGCSELQCNKTTSNLTYLFWMHECGPHNKILPYPQNSVP